MDAIAGSLQEPKLETDGYLNPNVRNLRRSATIAINERCHELQQGGREVIRLGLGQSPFPVPETVVDELRRHAHQKAYLPVQGLMALRAATLSPMRVITRASGPI